MDELKRIIEDSEVCIALCSCRKYPYPPQGRLMEIPREMGVSKAQIFKGKYGSKMESPEGVGGSS